MDSVSHVSNFWFEDADHIIYVYIKKLYMCSVICVAWRSLQTIISLCCTMMNKWLYILRLYFLKQSFFFAFRSFIHI